MSVISNKPGAIFLLAALAVPATGSLSAQEQDTSNSEVLTTVVGTEGPTIEGIISARQGDRMQITSENGTRTMVTINDDTQIKGRGGFLGLNSKKLASDALLNGLPITVDTWRSGETLVAREIKFKNNDLETAAMIRNGTAQRFAEHDVAIEENAAATEALRGRMGDIDKYNIKGTTNVYFDTGKWALTPAAQNDLCTAANEAEAMDNALLLVVGYTDSTGSYEVNQTLSEKRAGRVVNYLQQACGWKPWRMLSPTGMATADPLADNNTAEGRAQNRRVGVNILVSKSVDGI